MILAIVTVVPVVTIVAIVLMGKPIVIVQGQMGRLGLSDDLLETKLIGCEEIAPS